MNNIEDFSLYHSSNERLFQLFKIVNGVELPWGDKIYYEGSSIISFVQLLEILTGKKYVLYNTFGGVKYVFKDQADCFEST